MHFVLIYPGFGVLGGIETLIARMSRWLVANGHQVTVLTESLRNWGDLLPKEAHALELGDRFRQLYYYFHGQNVLAEFGVRPPDVIKSFDLQSSWVACQLAARAGNGCRVIAGIYNPNVFKSQYTGDAMAFWTVESLHLRNFLQSIPASARVFCWAEDMKELEEIHGQQAVLWPLPIDTRQFHPAAHRAKRGNIVSVGRLSVMKEYNLYMIDIVRDLVRKGHEVSWTVYGDGKYESQMRENIRRHGLENVITLKGSIPYERLWQALSDAYVFVGMGTAVLEAALFGIPVVTARPYDREGMTCGPLYQFPPGCVQFSDPAQPLLKVADEIERVLCLTPEGYRAEQEKIRAYVQMYEMDSSMQRFLKLVREAEPFSRRMGLYLMNYPLHLIRRFKRRLDNDPVTPVSTCKGVAN